MDLLYDPAMSLVLKGHAHRDLCFMPIHKHTLQCVPQFTLVIRFLFPNHLFFQGDQNKCLETKLFGSIQAHKILTVAPLFFLLNFRTAYLHT